MNIEMCEIVDISDDDEDSQVSENHAAVRPKEEVLDHDPLPPQRLYRQHVGDNVGSSSGSNLRSSFIEMGFTPFLVDRVIEEKGGGNIDVLMDMLSAYSAPEEPKAEIDDYLFDGFNDGLAMNINPSQGLQKSESSDSIDRLFDDFEDTNSQADHVADFQLKEEPDLGIAISDKKKATLLTMKFSLKEIEFAMTKLGEAASINQIMDHIFAAKMAEKYEKASNGPPDVKEEREKECDTEALFGIMHKTLTLLEMGFSEQDISTAFEKYGSEVTLQELANKIVADQNASMDLKAAQDLSTSFILGNSTTSNDNRSSSSRMDDHLGYQSFIGVTVKTEAYCSGAFGEIENLNVLEKLKGKRPEENYHDESRFLKKPKQEFGVDLSRSVGSRLGNLTPTNHTVPIFRRGQCNIGRLEEFEVSKVSMPTPHKSHDSLVAEPPYFFYGNVTDLSPESWTKISNFLYSVPPEFANTQQFSALNRKEGYVHNLPIENRFHILPKQPTTITEAIPNTRSWWPLWDTRKQLSCICSDTSGSQLCDRLGRMLSDCRGRLSVQQQMDLIDKCNTFNLIWVGQYKLAPIKPEHIERILGYPSRHTWSTKLSEFERLQSLKHAFQVDTLGYHLSGLKSLFPEGGIRVFSIYSGIGGIEIALHRLGIRLKCVVSVESCEKKQNILKQWWKNSGQIGELVQLESVKKLDSNKLEDLIKRFNGFDFVVCQNPYASVDSNHLAGLDFSLFVEFFRVLRTIRTAMERLR